MKNTKIALLTVFTPLIITDILYYVLYHATCELIHPAFASIQASGINLPAIYLVNDFPHRLLLPQILLLILSAFIISSLLKLDSVKEAFKKTNRRIINIVVKAKALVFALGTYLYWYFVIEPKYFVSDISSIENPLISWEKLMMYFFAILAVVVYAIAIWDIFKLKKKTSLS